jgi:hypothetical protein
MSVQKRNSTALPGRRHLVAPDFYQKHNCRLLLGIAVVVLVYLAAGLWFRPIVSGDALNGMVSLLNHLNGSVWNISYSLSADR